MHFQFEANHSSDARLRGRQRQIPRAFTFNSTFKVEDTVGALFQKNGYLTDARAWQCPESKVVTGSSTKPPLTDFMAYGYAFPKYYWEMPAIAVNPKYIMWVCGNINRVHSMSAFFPGIQGSAVSTNHGMVIFSCGDGSVQKARISDWNAIFPTLIPPYNTVVARGQTWVW